MATINRRVTAKIEGDFVVFIIGMRVNKPWKLHKWLPVFAAMPQMIAELEKDPESGFLGAEQFINPFKPVLVQYWRSFEALEKYARDARAEALARLAEVQPARRQQRRRRHLARDLQGRGRPVRVHLQQHAAGRPRQGRRTREDVGGTNESAAVRMGGNPVITTFDSSYAGSLDMYDVGYGGTAVNSRRYSNDELVTVFDKSEAIAKQLDALGFDTFWMAEHHFQPEGYEGIPNLLMLAVHLSHVTPRLRFGTGFNIVPMWHPLRLAEDYAMADVLTGGRVIFGVGRGYHSREIETFGAPLFDQDANRELFEEQVDVIMKAFREESFAHHGKHYDLPPAVPYRGYTLENLTLVPRPVHQRRVLAADPGRHGPRARLHGEARHEGHDRRRRGRGRRHGQRHPRLPRRLRAHRHRQGAGRGPQRRLPVLHRPDRGAGAARGRAVLRREPQDVRPAAPASRHDASSRSTTSATRPSRPPPACRRSKTPRAPAPSWPDRRS